MSLKGKFIDVYLIIPYEPLSIDITYREIVRSSRMLGTKIDWRLLLFWMPDIYDFDIHVVFSFF